ncbi:hypothetical protein PDTK01_31440 [Phycicoccus sp. DTK01]|nr:hypothetical protein PDTK01_31440 [Phycicoccus sp. DTK01]
MRIVVVTELPSTRTSRGSSTATVSGRRSTTARPRSIRVRGTRVVTRPTAPFEHTGPPVLRGAERRVPTCRPRPGVGRVSATETTTPPEVGLRVDVDGIGTNDHRVVTDVLSAP